MSSSNPEYTFVTTQMVDVYTSLEKRVGEEVSDERISELMLSVLNDLRRRSLHRPYYFCDLESGVAERLIAYACVGELAHEALVGGIDVRDFMEAGSAFVNVIKNTGR